MSLPTGMSLYSPFWESFSEEIREAISKASSQVKFVLSEEQWENALSVVSTLLENPYVFEKSQTGAGKTYMTTMVVAILNQLLKKHDQEVSVLVVCPKNAMNTWSKLGKLSDFHFNTMTYETLSGAKALSNYQKSEKNGHTVLSHGLLSVDVLTEKRIKYGEEKEDVFYTYAPTAYWVEKVQNSTVFVIFDESQKMKNQSFINGACTGLLNPIVTGETFSRIMFVTATPGDKAEQGLSYLRVLGAIDQNRPLFSKVNNFRGNYVRDGINQISQFFQNLSKDGKISLSMSDKNSLSEVRPGKQSKDLIFRLFTDYVFKNFSSGITAGIDKKMYVHNNLFIQLPNEIRQEFDELVAELRELIFAGKDRFGLAGKSDSRMGRYNVLIMKIQILKSRVIVDKILEKLEENPNNKIVICANYLEVLDYTREFLEQKGYRILQIDGSIDQEERALYERRFQRPDNKYRVMQLSTNAGSVAISLHDEDGRFPRTSYIFPSFFLTNMVQANGRIVRSGLKSLATNNTIWAADNTRLNEGNILVDSEDETKKTRCLELDLMSTIWNRSNIAQKMIRGKTKNEGITGEAVNGVLYPDGYRNVIV